MNIKAVVLGRDRGPHPEFVLLPDLKTFHRAAVACLLPLLTFFSCARSEKTAQPASPTVATAAPTHEHAARVMAATEECTDEGFPYGRPARIGQAGGYCYNCAGQAVGLATLPDIHFNIQCVPLSGSPGPTTTATRPPPAATTTPTPTRTAPVATYTPEITVSIPTLEIPRDRLAVSKYLLWAVNKLSSSCDRYQIQFNYAGIFAPDYEGPFPPTSDPGMAGGFVWPCEPPGLPLTGENCRSSASAYSFAYRVHDIGGWSAPSVQTYRITWLNSCSPR